MIEIRPHLVGTSTILVGETELTPGSPHLFALLLALALAPRQAWTRRALQDLLFGGTDERTASHRLRQLLYRLRVFGLVLDEPPGGLLSVENPIADPLAMAACLDGARVAAGEPLPGVLPLYQPRLPEPFLEWLDVQRIALERRLAGLRAASLRRSRERQEWVEAARLATALQATDPHNEEWVLAAAESQAMLGRRDEALETIDRFVRESDDELSSWPALKRLRARITSTRIARREGTLRGREECLALLAREWAQARAGGGGRACVVLGPPGMGKTRVGEAFSATARLGGAQLLQHRCDNQARDVPLALFSRLVPELRQRRGSIGADPALAGALDRVAPSEVRDLSDLGSVEDRRAELKRAIIDLLEAVSNEQPVLVVVDDAHLLDEASHAVIHALADGDNTAQVLVLLLSRPRPDGRGLISSSARATTYALPPLGEADSRALLVELAGARPPSAAEIEWAVAQAAGNAFYLNALAQHPSASVALPVHIRSLAQASYFALAPDARSVLDASLLLDTLASPARVTQVAGGDDRSLLAALRALEESDLLRCEDGLFLGPHAIMREALDELMPTTTRAVMHRRIALLLSAECSSPTQARVVGWAAVSSWLAAGESEAAVELALRLAAGAQSVGEPEAGAQLLNQLPVKLFAIPAQRAVLDEMIRLSDAGKCPSLMTEALRQRAHLASVTHESPNTIASLNMQLVLREVLRHKNYDSATLRAIISNEALDPHLRADAGARLLAIADLHFDKRLAVEVHGQLIRLEEGHATANSHILRAHIVYHTTWGDPREALRLANSLAIQYESPSNEDEPRLSRAYIQVCLMRLGFYPRAADLAKADWQFLSENGHLLSAEYAGSVAADCLISAGDYVGASEILTELTRATAQRKSVEQEHHSPFYSASFSLAMHQGDFRAAERLVEEEIVSFGKAPAPRMRGVSLGHLLRLHAARSGEQSRFEHVEELELLFERAKCLCGQDATAEALWHHYVAEGNSSQASCLLRRYLLVRRELGAPEAPFRESTAKDPAWSAVASLQAG